MPGRVEARDKIVEKLFVQKDVKVVRDEIPYYNDRIVETERVVEKIVPVERVIREVMEVPYMVEKIINSVVQIPTVH